MKRAAKLLLGSVIVVGVLLVLFLLPVVSISVQYACTGNATDCADLSYSTFGSVTYAAFGSGVVYVRDNTDGTFSQLCWMTGNPVNNPSVNGGAMCSTLVS